MEICRSSQMSFVGLMQLPHWQSNLQAVLLPQGNIHMIPIPTVTTSGLLVAHTEPDPGPWAGSSHGGVSWGGAGGAGLAPGTAGHPTATASLPRPVLPCLCYSLGGEQTNKSPALARNHARSSAVGKGSEVCSGSAGRAHTGPSPLACV